MHNHRHFELLMQLDYNDKRVKRVLTIAIVSYVVLVPLVLYILCSLGS